MHTPLIFAALNNNQQLQIITMLIIVGVDRGVPNPRFPPPSPHFPPPRPPHFPPSRPPLPSPWNISPAPIEKKKKKQVSSSYNLSFQCIDYYQSFKTVGQFVCSSVHLLVCFGDLQPSQRPSRQHCSQVKPCLWRKGKDKRKQDRWEKKCKHSRSLSYYNPKQ